MMALSSLMDFWFLMVWISFMFQANLCNVGIFRTKRQVYFWFHSLMMPSFDTVRVVGIYSCSFVPMTICF